jgi:hypothetical protein
MFNSAIEYALFLFSLEIATLFGSVILILKKGGF